MYKERYLITGGSGFIGTQLTKQLLLEGHQVTLLTRDEVKTLNHFDSLMKQAQIERDAPNTAQATVKTITGFEQLTDDDSFNVVINLAGQGIAEKRWSDKVKQQLIDSRINTTRALYDYLKDALVKPDVLVSGSALGFYGYQHGDTPLDESAQGDNSFSSRLCASWEAQARQIEALGIRSCYLRTGIVLGKNGGALAKMLAAFKWGLGGPMGSGKQWMSWIHMDDIVGIIRYAVAHEEISGAINATAPTPVTNKTFAKVLGKALKRPALIPMPAFLLKLMMGQMAEELLLSGQRVMPQKMLDAGYNFKFKQLADALDKIVID